MDSNTAQQVRGKFARVYMELDLDNPLVAQYRLNGKLMAIKYEGMHLICFRYGKYGHDKDACPLQMNMGPKHSQNPNTSKREGGDGQRWG